MLPEALSLCEELMLLTFKDDEGTVAGGAMYQYAIGGALIAELIMAQRVTVERDSKHDVLRVVDRTPLSDPLVDERLEERKDRLSTIAEGSVAVGATAEAIAAMQAAIMVAVVVPTIVSS